MLITAKKTDKFYEICHSVFKSHAFRKEMYIHRNKKPLMTKRIQELLCKECVLETNF